MFLRVLVWLAACAAARAAAPVPLSGIAHIGFRVSDAGRAEAYYSGVLGLPRAFATGSAVFYKVSDEQYVEIEPGLAGEDIRLTHIALQTSDAQAARRALRGHGISAPAAAKDAAGNLAFTIQAPENTRLDFVEYRESSQQALNRGRLAGATGISTHLQHTGVIVPREKLDAVVRFYRDVLGCEEVWRLDDQPGQPRLIKMRLPGARRDIIELMIHSGGLDRGRIGSMHHINFEVADIHAAHRYVLAHGAKVAANFRPRVNAEDIWSFNLLDPDGSRTEVQDLTKIPQATLTEETFHGRRAWVLSNGWMRVAVLAGGGHIAEVRMISDDPKKSVNPMRVPHYPTIEPYQYDDARDNPVYGDTPHRWLSAGYMGHLLCFPIYGPPSEEEARAGLGNHGEAPIVEWRKISSEANSEGVTLRYGADLPRTQYRAERTVTLPRGMRVVRVEEWVENLAPFDRPINWMQHATFGPPFVEPGKTVFDASVADRKAQAGRRVFASTPRSGSYTAMRTDPARTEEFFTLYHPDYRVLIGYLFPAAGNPWIADWQENQRSTVPPWNGQVIARGIEFGSSPYAEGLRKSVERNSYEGAPAFRWIGARQKLKTEFSIFLQEIPAGFQGVRDARSEHGVPLVAPGS